MSELQSLTGTINYDRVYPTIDASLSIEGAAADAKATGKAVTAANVFNSGVAATGYPTSPGIYRTVGTNIFANLSLSTSRLYGVLVIFKSTYAMHLYTDTYGDMYVGKSADVFCEPTSWRKLELKPELVWQNASAGSEFAAQTISVDLSLYSEILVVFNTITSGGYRSTPVRATAKTYNYQTIARDSGYIYTRFFNWNVTGVTFMDAGKISAYGSSPVNANTYLIPYAIYGIR